MFSVLKGRAISGNDEFLFVSCHHCHCVKLTRAKLDCDWSTRALRDESLASDWLNMEPRQDTHVSRMKNNQFSLRLVLQEPSMRKVGLTSSWQ